MKRNLLILFLSLILSPLAYGQNHWDVDNNQWGLTMTIIAVVQVDGVELRTGDIEIAAFNNNELRSDGVKLKYEASLDRYIAYLYPRGDNNYTITYKLYDHSIGKELDYICLTSTQYVVQTGVGEIENPYVIDFEVPNPAFVFMGNGSWDNASNWENENLPTEEDNVVINGDATISNEVSVNNLAINKGKSLTIQDGGVLTVVGRLTNADYDALIIEDGGQIFQTNEDVAATFKKNIVIPSSWTNPVSGWQFISSPMVDAATEDFASTEGDYDLYKFDGSEEQQWVNYKNHDDFEETFITGIGYIASYQNQDAALFKGNLNVPEADDEEEYFDFEVNYNSTNEWARFNLLGNPFCFDIVWEDNMDCNKIAEDGFITLNPETGSYIYNVEGTIKAGEGFMVYTNKSRPSLTYYKSLSKSRKVKPDYINIIALNNNASDNLIICFGENETEGLPKLENINKNIASIYVKENSNRCGIITYTKELKEIPLCFDTKEMGNYTIKANVNGEFDNVILVDRITGVETNLLLEDYTFTSRSYDDKSRFILKLAHSSQPDAHGNFAYQSGNDLIIDAEGTIQIIDIMGRVIMTEESHNGTINISGLDNATYIVRCVNENEVRTQKIVVL